jgi:GTP cyclohydrolase II/3,4-dihydroxy 2-butanone 4-phosphate synthase/GTP cyclohydrolase II
LPVDSRDYRPAADILDQLGIRRVRLLTNNPDKVTALREHRITVEQQLAHEFTPNRYNRGYLTAKRDRLGHTLQRLG